MEAIIGHEGPRAVGAVACSILLKLMQRALTTPVLGGAGEEKADAVAPAVTVRGGEERSGVIPARRTGEGR